MATDRMVGESYRDACARLYGQLRAAEIDRDRRAAELARFGDCPMEAAFLVHGEPHQLMFRGEHGPFVLRRRQADPDRIETAAQILHSRHHRAGTANTCGSCRDDATAILEGFDHG